MYSEYQKRSPCWPSGCSVIMAMLLQVKGYSVDVQIKYVNIQAQKIILMLHIGSVKSN